MRTRGLVTILRPVEAIVRDRAALLGFQSLVEQSYEALTEALNSVGVVSDLERQESESQRRVSSGQRGGSGGDHAADGQAATTT